jgi:hypothetical protein
MSSKLKTFILHCCPYTNQPTKSSEREPRVTSSPIVSASVFTLRQPSPTCLARESAHAHAAVNARRTDASTAARQAELPYWHTHRCRSTRQAVVKPVVKALGHLVVLEHPSIPLAVWPTAVVVALTCNPS